jgi:hypothetical protein
MSSEFRERMDTTLRAYGEWAATRHRLPCRLVSYCGVECAGGIEVPPDEVEAEIIGAICEGMGIDWSEHQDRLYLVVWEPEGLPWTWQAVFDEQHLAPDSAE